MTNPSRPYNAVYPKLLETLANYPYCYFTPKTLAITSNVNEATARRMLPILLQRNKVKRIKKGIYQYKNQTEEPQNAS